MMNGRDENEMPVGLKLIPGYKVVTLVMETLVWWTFDTWQMQ